MKQTAIIVFLAANLLLTLLVDISPWREMRGKLQNNVGYAFWQGLFVSKDEERAASWFRLAVANGSAEAANNLGNLYEDRPYKTVDRQTLIALYRIAADDGIATAQNNLGVLLLKTDPVEAAAWFERAVQSRDSSISDAAAENLAVARSQLRSQ